MKINIITCHDVYNYGASLQAYALMTYLSTKGHDTAIIDYKPDYLSHHYESGYVDEKNRYYPLCQKYKLIKFLYSLRLIPITYATWRRIKPFNTFKKDRLLCTKCYSSLQSLQNDPPIADLYIAGSDQIWNCNLPNGKDAAFFLNFGTPKRRISYAASFAMEFIPEQYIDMLNDYLQNLDNISVRESSAVQLLDNIGIKSKLVVDPVYLLSRQQWSDFAGEKTFIDGKYILVYNLNHSNSAAIKEEAVKLSKIYGLKIIAIDSSFKCNFSNKNMHNAGPVEFVNLIKHASFMVTDSFHGMSFSLIMHRPFSVWHKHSDSSRIHDLLKDIGADSCINNSITNFDLQWDSVDERLYSKVKDSESFLDYNIAIVQAYE